MLNSDCIILLPNFLLEIIKIAEESLFGGLTHTWLETDAFIERAPNHTVGGAHKHSFVMMLTVSMTGVAITHLHILQALLGADLLQELLV